MKARIERFRGCWRWCREVWRGLQWLCKNGHKADFWLQYYPEGRNYLQGRKVAIASINDCNRPYLSYTWDGDGMFWRRHTYMVEWYLWYANRMRGPMPLAEHRRYWQERLGRWLAVPWARGRKA